MPWAVISPPALALGILKKCLRREGFPVDVHYLNLQFADQIGFDLYENISKEGHLFYPDWFFAPRLFGPDGTGELRNLWSDIRELPLARELVRTLQSFAGSVEKAESICSELASEQVARFIQTCTNDIDWAAYRVIGFTTTFAQSLASLLLAKELKERFPHVVIVFGGANVDAEMGIEFIRAFEWVDYVVHGEAEESFPLLLKSIGLQDKTFLRGVTLRDGTSVIEGNLSARPIADLNTSPAPDYSDYMQQLQRTTLPEKVKLFLYFESSRGCWWGAKHHCTFCGLNGTTMAHRTKDPELVYSEILEISERNHCTTLAATDNILALDYFHTLLPKLAAADIDLDLFYEIKANLNRQQMRALVDAGIRRIQPGIESLNTRLLELMRKGITAIQNIQLLRLCYEFDIKPHWTILYGFPGENAADYDALPRTARLLEHLYPPGGISRVIFERFSPYYFDREQFGLRLHPDGAYSSIFPPSRVQIDKLAYYFRQEPTDQRPEPDDYIMESRAAITRWQEHFRTNEAACYFRKGPGYIQIEDSRPLNAEAALNTRRIRLSGLTAAIYLFCNDIRSLSAIKATAAEIRGSKSSESEVQRILDRLTEQGLMFRENNRYLSLAVRERSTFYTRGV